MLALMATTAVAEAEPDDDAWRDRALATMQALTTYETPDGNYIVGVPDDEVNQAFGVHSDLVLEPLQPASLLHLGFLFGGGSGR